jgi:hypothetical protein
MRDRGTEVEAGVAEVWKTGWKKGGGKEDGSERSYVFVAEFLR